MIDLNGVASNSSSLQDSPMPLQDVSTPELLDQPTDISTPTDLNAFVLLMAQMLAQPSEDVPITTVKTDTETQIDLIDIDCKAEEDDPLVSDQIIPDSSLLQSQEPAINTNVAMAWINSESYVPPQSLTAVVEEELTKKVGIDLTDKTNADLSLENPLDFTSESADINEEIRLPDDLVKHLLNQKNIKLTESIDTKVISPAKGDLLQNLQSFAAMTTLQGREVTGTKAQEPIETASSEPQISLAATSIHDNRNAMPNAIDKSLSIPVATNNPEWAEQFSEHIMWLGQQGIKSAHIKLHPEELGPIEINIRVIKDAASLNITSHSSHVREIVEQSLPRLQEMMADQGLKLSDVHVGADTNAHQSAQQQASSEQEFVENTEEPVIMTPLTTRHQKGLIDYFA